MKTIYKKLLFLFLILPFSVFSQTLSGVVLDGSSSQPLPGVNIIVKGASNSTTTDFDGRFKRHAISLFLSPFEDLSPKFH